MAADDYDDEITIPEPDWGHQWDPLEWEDLRASRRFSAFVKLALRAAARLGDGLDPIKCHTEADWLFQLAQHHKDLWEYHEEAVWRLIKWLRDGAPRPKPVKLSIEVDIFRSDAVDHYKDRRRWQLVKWLTRFKRRRP